MKKMTLLATATLISCLALPALAAPTDKEKKTPPPAAVVETAQDPHESKAFQQQKAYREKREAMKQRRDEALKVRERNVRTDNPGQTGL